jgi:hypothetical protein
VAVGGGPKGGAEGEEGKKNDPNDDDDDDDDEDELSRAIREAQYCMDEMQKKRELEVRESHACLRFVSRMLAGRLRMIPRVSVSASHR